MVVLEKTPAVIAKELVESQRGVVGEEASAALLGFVESAERVFCQRPIRLEDLHEYEEAIDILEMYCAADLRVLELHLAIDSILVRVAQFQPVR